MTGSLRTICTTLRALLKLGLCATHLCPRTDTSSYQHCPNTFRPPPSVKWANAYPLQHPFSLHSVHHSLVVVGCVTWSSAVHMWREVDPRSKRVFSLFSQTDPDNSEQLKAIWGCRGQVGRLMAFHFSWPTFKQGNNIKVSWFYHEVSFASIFALFELLLAGLASRISWVIYYQNDGLMCAREWFPSLPLFNVQASNNVSHQHCISPIYMYSTNAFKAQSFLMHVKFPLILL